VLRSWRQLDDRLARLRRGVPEHVGLRHRAATDVDSPPVDPFAVIMLGIVGAMLVSLVLLGLFHPRSGAQTLDWKPTRSAEAEIQNEIDDLDQMLEAANERRRRRGAPELTEEGIRASVGADLADTIKRREEHLAELEVVQMLDVKNARRRAKGLPEITVEEYRARILGEQKGPRGEDGA
jgi:hypothetical protein